MGRLIEEDAFVERITKLQEEIAENSECYHDDAEIVEVLDYVLVLLGEQSTIEAKPVVHGRWQCVFENNMGRKVGWCSNCGFLEEVNNYCPNCGAKMDGGNQNE